MLFVSSIILQKLNGEVANKSCNLLSYSSVNSDILKFIRFSSPVNSIFSNCMKLVILKSARPCTLICGFGSPFSKSTQILSNSSSEPYYSKSLKYVFFSLHSSGRK